MSERRDPEHYSYTVYADPAVARTFDDRRFGGPVGALVADSQARLLAGAIDGLDEPAVLDVGTGTGRAALLLARRGARVTGVDASDEMLAVARTRAAAEGLAVEFRRGDAHALDLPDRAVDVVVCLRVIMHTPRWRIAVHELCRVAGRLVVLDFPSATSGALLESLWRKLAAGLGSPTEPYRVFLPSTLARALSAEGFRLRSVHRQFVLPIALHKTIGSAAFTTAAEHALARVGLLRVLGSPITVIAERCGS